MSRKFYVIIVTAVCLFAAFFVMAQDFSNIPERVKNAKDYEAVSNVIYREINGWFKNDPEQIFSVFDADNFMGISAFGTNDPKEWTVSASGRADVRAYADRAKDSYKNLPEEFQHKAEVQHVHIKGNHALAVARQWSQRPDEEKDRTTNTQFETVWMLRKTGGQWKVIGLIGGVTYKQEVTEN